MGLHRTPKFGFSQEFAEYRAYEPGDDLRHIDWNVYARSDRTYIKRFSGDTNNHVMVLVDQSSSMAANAGNEKYLSKCDYARYAAASFVYLAARQHDAIGLLLFNDSIGAYRAPSTRHTHVRMLYHLLDDMPCAGGSDWHLPLEHVQSRLHRRSLLVVISDFYTQPTELRDVLKSLAARGHDLLLVHVLDPTERQADLFDAVTLEDSETGTVMEVSPDEVATGYAQRLRTHVDGLRQAVIEAGGHYLGVTTDQPLDRTLADYLRFRARRRQ